MVGEFPELQGTIGKYYAQHDGELPEVCTSLEEQYLPRFAGDRLPSTAAGRCVALADKLDLIAGIFSIGQKPSGTRDPYGLRRAALGVLRIILEAGLELDLRSLIDKAIALQPTQAAPGLADEIWMYIAERFRSFVLETDSSITTEMFDAVLATTPRSLLDVQARLAALKSFLLLPESTALASANKRIANILRKAAAEDARSINGEHLVEPVERQLFEHLLLLEQQTAPAFARRDYEQALTALAALKDDVDRFFDGVMVMTEDARLRTNRLGLLATIRNLFLRAADLSKLPG